MSEIRAGQPMSSDAGLATLAVDGVVVDGRDRVGDVCSGRDRDHGNRGWNDEQAVHGEVRSEATRRDRPSHAHRGEGPGAVLGEWDDEGEKLSIEWLCDGEPITPFSRRAPLTHKLTGRDLGSSITVRDTARVAATGMEASADSAPISVAAPGEGED